MGGIGGTIGGILGGVIGSAIPGGTVIGASLGTGIGQLIEGGVQKKKAKAMAPSPVDVGRNRLLQELYRQQKRVLTGTQSASKDAQQLAKTMQRNAFAAGGAVPNYSGKIISDLMSNIREGEANQLLNLNTQIAQSVGEKEKRAFDLQSLAQSKVEADAAQNLKDSGQNLAAALQPQGDFSYNELGETPEEARKRKAAEAKAAKDAKDAAKTEGLT
jgi:hypothetical protein